MKVNYIVIAGKIDHFLKNFRRFYQIEFFFKNKLYSLQITILIIKKNISIYLLMYIFFYF